MSCPRDCLILAGVGGAIPTISRLASTYVSDPTTPLPEPGLYFGLLLFFIIGSVLAYAFSERNMRQAFILGVCAPGIITNIVAGVNDANLSSQTAFLDITPSFISSAYAQDSDVTPVGAGVDTRITTSGVTKIPKNIIVNSNVYGAGAWDMKNIPIFVTAIEKDGSKKNIAGFPAYQGSIEVEVPENTVAVQIRAAGYTNQITLPDVNFTQATINSQVRVEGKHDFLWALGAKRSPKVVSVNSSLGNVIVAKPSVTVKELLGEKVKTQDGRPVGKLEDIEIGPSGSIDKLLIKEEAGQIKSVLPQDVDRVNKQLILQQ